MEVYYKPSDIVWVKLGPFWWPGEVVDKSTVPELLIESLKKEPVAIVKYFDDDGLYEIVKTPDRIYPYNCERKHDFIKKGMDAFRAKNPKMTSFPKDVSAAEIKTGGNANILSDPIFTTERKRNYAAEIFGSPAVKKPRESNKARAIKSDPIITHRRFLGYDDYEARILIQSPEDAPQEEEVPAAAPSKKFTCPVCQFSTERLGILTRHTSCHMKDVSFTSRQPIKKPQKRKRRKALSDDDLSEDEKKTKTKRKYTKKKQDDASMADDEKSENDVSVSKEKLKRKQKKKTAEQTVEEKKDICTDIIADWDDESNQEDSTEENTTLVSSLNETVDSVINDTTFVDSSFALDITDAEDLQSTKIVEESDKEKQNEDGKTEETDKEKQNEDGKTEETDKEKQNEDGKTEEADKVKQNEDGTTEETEKEKQNEDSKTSEKEPNKSCFDFDEDEEETKIPDATSGRKIPRVIPISERRKTFELDEVLVDEEEEKKKKILEESEELAKLTEPSIDEDKEVENLEKTYQSLMESTENIELPDVPNILKNEQNFHSAKTVKYPDKPDKDSSDLIEAELENNIAEKPVEESKEPEKVEIIEEVPETKVVEAATPQEVNEKFPEQSSTSEDKNLEEEETKQTTKGKRKRGAVTVQPRRSTRSKPALTEADIDAALLKYRAESEETKDSENTQVPLSVLSPSKVEERTVEVEVSTETDKIEVNSKQIQEEVVSNESNKDTTLNKDPEVLEKEEPNQLETNNDCEHQEDVILGEEITIDEEVKQKHEEKIVITEEPEVEVEFAEQQLEVCAEESVSTEPAETVEELSQITTEKAETATKVESNDIEEKTVDEELQPEAKRRKTNRGSSRSSKSKEPLSQGNRRGRSRDAEVLKLEESLSSPSSERKNKKEHKSLPTRKSTRWDRKLSNDNKEASNSEVTVEETSSTTCKEINDIIIGDVETKVNVDILDKDSTTLPESESKVDDNEKPSENKESLLVEEMPSEVPPKTAAKDVLEHAEKKEDIIDSAVIPEQKIEEPITDSKNVEHSSSEKGEKPNEERSSDHEKDRKSSHRSPKKEKRSSRSGKDHKKDDTSKMEDNSSHRESSRSLRGDHSSHKERKRSLRGDNSSHRDEKADSSSHKEEKRSLRGNSSSHREDDRTIKRDNPPHKEDSVHKEEKRSLRGNSSSHKEDDRTIKTDNPSHKEDSAHKEEKRSLRGNTSSHRDDRSTKGDNSSHIESDRSVKPDNSSLKVESSAHKEEKRSLRGNTSSHRDDRSTRGDNSSHIESDRSVKPDNSSLKGDSSSHKEAKRSSVRGEKSSRKEESSSQRDDSSSHRSSRSSRKSGRQEKEKQDTPEVNKTERPDEKHPKDSSSSRKPSSSKDSHNRKVDVPATNDQEDDASRRSTRKDKKSSRSDQDSQNHKPVNEQESDDRNDHNLSSRSSRRHGRSSKTYPESSKSEEKESKASSPAKKQDSKKSEKISKEIDPIKALFSPVETVAKTKEQKREELKSIFSFDYDEEELKKRKTYSHKRKAKPVVSEKPAEVIVPPEVNTVEITSETKDVFSLNSTEYENKNIDSIDQTVIESCTDTLVVDEHKLIISEPEASKDISQKIPEEKLEPKESAQKEEEISNIPEEKDAACISEVPQTETKQEVCESKEKEETELSIDTSEIQNDIVVEDKVSEINQNEQITVDSKQECNDPKKNEISSTDIEDKKIVTVKSTRRKKPRKPSRWDQIEKTDVVNNQEISIEQPQTVDVAPVEETIESQLQKLETEPAEVPIESQLQILETEPPKETIESQLQILEAEPTKGTVESQETENAKETIESQLQKEPAKETIESQSEASQDVNVKSDDPESSLGIDETSQKEMNDIFSKKEPSDYADKNAAQIELIFGSSPLPGLSENNIFVEKKEKSETVNDQHELSVTSEEKKKDSNVVAEDSSQNTSFEQTDDLLESVESQVARITHYEEPVPKEETSSSSIFDTPEKHKKPDREPDSPVNKTDVSNDSSSTNKDSKPEESCSNKSETSSISAPKTKKTHLLSEQAIRETVEKSPEISVESASTKDTLPSKSADKTNEVATEVLVESATTKDTLPSKSADKTNEVATKLTNPKKRFVKSFEDSELNKKKEKSLEADKSIKTEVKTETSPLIGKSPIAFKLKKQFLSKISSIFDEADEKKETKILPKLKTAKQDSFSKKKDPVVTGKTAIEAAISEDKSIPPEKTETEELVSEVVNEIDIVSAEDKSEESETPSEIFEHKCQETITPPLVTEVESVSTIEEPVLEEKVAPENSISFSFDSVEETKTLLTDIPVESLEQQEDIVVSKTEIITTNFPLVEDKKEETEYVSIDGNLTVVSEKELAEGQVEITSSAPVKKPMTLLNFSMDFSDDSTDASFEAFKNEKIQGITESLDNKNVEEEKEKHLDTKKKEENIDDKGKKPIVCEEKKDVDIKQKEEEIDRKDKPDKPVETKLNLMNNIEIESTSSSTQIVEQIVEVCETKKEEIHDISIEDILESSISVEKEKELAAETKEAETDILSILSEHVKITNKATAKSKSKDSEKPTGSKKNERKGLQSAEEVPVVNEPLVIYNTAKSSTVTDMCDLEDHIPSQIVCTKNALINDEVMKVAAINNELSKDTTIQKTEPQMSKLLSRLTADKKDLEPKPKEVEQKTPRADTSISKNLLKAAIKNKTMANTSMAHPSKPVNKAIILSEKIIRPARETAVPSSLASKRTYEDVEDIEPYVITKTPKLEIKKDETPGSGNQKVSTPTRLGVNSPKQFVYSGANKQLVNIKKSAGKAKILNQTIIRPAGESIQTKAMTEDNVDFDINSMPIVLSDELLTPETLENMPIVLGEQAQKVTSTSTENMKIVIEKKIQNNSKLVNKASAVSPATPVNSPTIRMPIVKRTPKILQTPKTTQKIIRQVTPSVSTKSSKFVVVSDSPSRPGQIIKKQTNVVRKTVPVTCAASSTPGTPSESTGHKIMIFTNQQGKQQRLLLTPAQQKLFSMQVAGKTVMKSAVAQKSQLAKVQNSGLMASTSKGPGQNVQSPKLVKTTVGTTAAGPPQMKIVPPKKGQKVFMAGSQMGKPPQQKTILITNQHGQTVRKISGTNDALLDKQVAEQLEAIKVSSMKAQLKQHEANVRAGVANKPVQGTIRKPLVKRSEPKQTLVAQPKPHPTTTTTSAASRLAQQHHIPPLSPIRQDKKPEEVLKQPQAQAKPAPAKPERPLHQLVIQDNAGNQTTITEGQILALPSETVDGQPQSYMLVTLDETGNLTPLNNEALMSLDPSLAGLTGGDLSNMVLQMDPGAQKGNMSQTAQLQAAPTIAQEKPKPEVQPPVAPPKPVEPIAAPLEQAQVQVTCNINGEPGQQIILTGDPAATQKFLDSLSDGSTDLANILAGAEGNSFLIQADGQQILINTEPTEAPLLRHNTSIAEQPDHRSPMFSNHPVKNQDILAAALADTDVFQQDQVSTQGKLTHSQLSPGQTLFPMNVGNVLETSLTLNSPIMTPLEVPSTNSKRIPDEEADILTTHVPKNVDLPITITDPNISQTVSHQQVLMASDLQSNLELSLPISETSMCVTSGMNSPSFVYSLPNLDVSEHADINQKTFSSSMPLLTEDIEESHSFAPLPPKVGSNTVSSLKKQKRDERHGIVESMSTRRMMSSAGTFMEEGLCTLGAEMCSSLSEPPPEMFDIPLESEGLTFLNKTQNVSKEKSDLLMDDNSLEMPVQSQIVEFKDSSQSSDSSQDKTL